MLRKWEAVCNRYRLLAHLQGGDILLSDIVVIALIGFTTGITTVLFGLRGGFVVVPSVYQLMFRQSELAGSAMRIAVATSTMAMIFNAGWVSYRN